MEDAAWFPWEMFGLANEREYLLVTDGETVVPAVAYRTPDGFGLDDLTWQQPNGQSPMVFTPAKFARIIDLARQADA